MKPISILDFTDEEQDKLARLLCAYFPWLMSLDETDVCGADTIVDLRELYSALPQHLY